jgi:drug/metabolite transporter (DMT)-like permease
MNADKEKWILLVTLSIIWGSSFILIKKSLEHFNPYQVGALEFLLPELFCFLLQFQIINFSQKTFKWLILAAFTGNFIPMFLFPIAETK